ncbi:MAG: PAS domain S-box protein [Cyanobacteria bacterium P01_E01_bin.6]
MDRLRLFNLFNARLSRKIVLWIFASIITIEGIILVPSVFRREQELLKYLEDVSTAKASGIFASKDLAVDDNQILQYTQSLQENNVVVGGALYRVDGSLVGTFGELPELTFQDVQRKKTILNRFDARYEAPWSMSPLEGRYVLIVRHDATSVNQEFFAFIARISGLVVIISAFVTMATWIVLDRLLISPILMLRQDLLGAGETLSHDDGDSKILEFEYVNTHRQDELGEVNQAFLQMVHQISEANINRRQAEENLRLSEEKFSKAFHSSPNPFTISTLTDGRLLDINESFLTLFEHDADSVLNHTAKDINLWVKVSDRAQMIRMVQERGFVRNREYQFRSGLGRIRTVLYSAEKIQINGDDCLLSVFSDITERKRAEIALRNSEVRFRTLIQQAVDGLLVLDAKGCVVDANRQACRNLQYSRQELLALSVSDFVVGIPIDHFADLWQQLATTESMTIEGKHRRKDGSIFPVEVRLGLLDYSDEKLILALVRDISERKKAEQAMARLAEIGELASMIVHEVRNPLTTVLMGLSSFQRMELPERAKARLALAMEESERLQRLLNEILLYAREQQLDACELNLSALLTELVESLREMPYATNRTIKFVSAQEDVVIKGDRDKLKQVFINLVSNACEAIPSGETICWRVENGLDPRRVQVSVHNGGDPIPPDVLPQLTKPFFTTKSSGNGLGLAITKRIIEAHNGTLTFTSTAEDGTTATVLLPRISS